jgi:hypothetical protein
MAMVLVGIKLSVCSIGEHLSSRVPFLNLFRSTTYSCADQNIVSRYIPNGPFSPLLKEQPALWSTRETSRVHSCKKNAAQSEEENE